MPRHKIGHRSYFPVLKTNRWGKRDNRLFMIDVRLGLIRNYCEVAHVSLELKNVIKISSISHIHKHRLTPKLELIFDDRLVIRLCIAFSFLIPHS